MNDIGIIDIEASGLHFDSYPIEVAVLLNGQSKSWLIKPEASWKHWCTTAESMHGITRKMLVNEGKNVEQVVDELVSFLENSNNVLYSDAVQWDIDWIDTLFFSVKRVRKFHVASIYDVLDKEQSVQFDEVKSRLAESGEYHHHRAEEDVKMIYGAYLEVIQRDQLGGATKSRCP